MPTATPSQTLATSAPESDAHLAADAHRARVAPMARAILLQAALLGVAADLLLRDGVMGLGLFLWLLLLSLSAVALVWRDGRPLNREAGTWLTVATLLGAAMAWRAADALQAFDFLAMLFSLGMAAIAIADVRVALFAERMRDTVWAAAKMVGSIAIGVVPLALRDAAPAASRREVGGRLRPILRVLLIALPLLLVFGSLLRSADPVFASIVALPDIDFETLASHVVLIGFFSWIVAGWARAALVSDHSRTRAPETLPFSLGQLDITAALGTLNALFALYVVTQLGWFFGGERFLQARTGLTAAEYARRGFFEMVWVVVLVLPLLLVTRAALRPGRDLARRHSMLALPMVGLLGVMIVSAMLRMRLYVHYYGLTLERFYPLVFMGWLAIVLAWLALTVLRGRGRMFVAGAVVSALVILASLNVVVPDLLVARVNVARASEPARSTEPAIDLPHLATLGAEAVPLSVSAVLGTPTAPTDSAAALREAHDRCRAASVLLRRWGPAGRVVASREASAAPWRMWNAGAAEATRVVGQNFARLLSVRHDACARERVLSPASNRPRPNAPAGR
ncbi:MAG TPA: DUF4173 domain-containing protein [Gemmatimonadaceae bacterium]|nr:DUF4173 domain-containing protein [Gemmatimonadaceae bacterium]